MSLPTRVLLVRHGQSVWNADGRWQGHADPPLSSLGRQQALAAAGHVGAIDVIVTSDLTRAVETATLIGDVIGIGPVDVDPRLRERDAGEWTGLTRDEIEAGWPGWIEDGRRPPAFEPWHHVATRVTHALAALHGRHPGHDVLAVAHGGVLNALLRAGGRTATLIPNLAGVQLDVDADRSEPIALQGDIVVLAAEVAVTAPPQL